MTTPPPTLTADQITAKQAELALRRLASTVLLEQTAGQAFHATVADALDHWMLSDRRARLTDAYVARLRTLVGFC